MQFNISHQSSYSRLELLLRSFFGIFYIIIPHTFVLIFVQLWSSILSFIAWWIILFTGSYPQSMFEFQVKLIRWSARLHASIYNLVDGYPAIGLGGSHEGVEFDMPYPSDLSRGILLLKTFFGIFYVIIPHGIALWGRSILGGIFTFIAWWVVLFTGSYPQGMHEYNVGTLRWGTRLSLYIMNMTDDYPPFSGK